MVPGGLVLAVFWAVAVCDAALAAQLSLAMLVSASHGGQDPSLDFRQGPVGF